MNYLELLNTISINGLHTVIEVVAYYIGYFGSVNKETFNLIVQAWENHIID